MLKIILNQDFLEALIFEKHENHEKADIIANTLRKDDYLYIPVHVLIMTLKKLEKYDYELMFIDNCSTDRTRELIRQVCRENDKIKAIFNVKNFGQFNSPYYGMCQLDGDCVISMCCDFQDPIEMIPVFVKYWEEGYQIVCGIKTSSKENKIIYWLRSIYYKLLKKYSSVEQIEQFTGFGLYDQSFIKVLRQLKDPTPFIRGIVAEFGGRRKEVPYEQPRRKAGKTHNNFYTLYDAAMLSFTSYTKIGMRLAVFIGLAFSFFSFVIGVVYLVMKLVYWDRFVAGQAPTIIILTMMCSIILVFLGILGEYILTINQRVMNRPLVIEEERINFDQKDIS